MASRRDFIRISAIGAGVLAAGAGTYKIVKALSSPEEAAKLVVDLKRTPTYCEVCFWKCAGWVYKTSEGKDLED
ncbi:MAG: twin-arginine translocation signal domain-containing protein [Marinilabiliales bacterium]|nr:twin-arginine translocation signal domain-containing protein [Marinilabiliales bacterium]